MKKNITLLHWKYNSNYVRDCPKLVEEVAKINFKDNTGGYEAEDEHILHQKI